MTELIAKSANASGIKNSGIVLFFAIDPVQKAYENTFPESSKCT